MYIICSPLFQQGKSVAIQSACVETDGVSFATLYLVSPSDCKGSIALKNDAATLQQSHSIRFFLWCCIGGGLISCCCSFRIIPSAIANRLFEKKPLRDLPDEARPKRFGPFHAHALWSRIPGMLQELTQNKRYNSYNMPGGVWKTGCHHMQFVNPVTKSSSPKPTVPVPLPLPLLLLLLLLLLRFLIREEAGKSEGCWTEGA